MAITFPNTKYFSNDHEASCKSQVGLVSLKAFSTLRLRVPTSSSCAGARRGDGDAILPHVHALCSGPFRPVAGCHCVRLYAPGCLVRVPCAYMYERTRVCCASCSVSCTGAGHASCVAHAHTRSSDTAVCRRNKMPDRPVSRVMAYVVMAYVVMAYIVMTASDRPVKCMALVHRIRPSVNQSSTCAVYRCAS